MAEPNKISDDQSMLDQINAQASGQTDGVAQIDPVRMVVNQDEIQTAPQLQGDVAASVVHCSDDRSRCRTTCCTHTGSRYI